MRADVDALSAMLKKPDNDEPPPLATRTTRSLKRKLTRWNERLWSPPKGKDSNPPTDVRVAAVISPPQGFVSSFRRGRPTRNWYGSRKRGGVPRRAPPRHTQLPRVAGGLWWGGAKKEVEENPLMSFAAARGGARQWGGGEGEGAGAGGWVLAPPRPRAWGGRGWGGRVLHRDRSGLFVVDDACEHLLQRVLQQRAHALIQRDLAQLVDRCALLHGALHVIRSRPAARERPCVLCSRCCCTPRSPSACRASAPDCNRRRCDRSTRGRTPP